MASPIQIPSPRPEELEFDCKVKRCDGCCVAMVEIFVWVELKFTGLDEEVARRFAQIAAGHPALVLVIPRSIYLTPNATQAFTLRLSHQLADRSVSVGVYNYCEAAYVMCASRDPRWPVGRRFDERLQPIGCAPSQARPAETPPPAARPPAPLPPEARQLIEEFDRLEAFLGQPNHSARKQQRRRSRLETLRAKLEALV